MFEYVYFVNHIASRLTWTYSQFFEIPPPSVVTDLLHELVIISFFLRYALPLFFIVVKTNIDYQVVATFVVESETKNAIAEALQVIKEWNPEFNPRVFMTDYDKAEIGAIRRTFGKTVNGAVYSNDDVSIGSFSAFSIP